MALPQNQAAWLPAKQVKPLKVGPAPYTLPGEGEIVVKNRAVAINSIDWTKQQLGDVLLSYIKYPAILGGDIAGTVVDVGPGVQRFKSAEGGFQLYTVAREYLAAPLPPHITEEEASVVPLTLCTAAYGLFHHDFLSLDTPTVPPRKTTGTGSSRNGTGTSGSSGKKPLLLPRAVIITGGSSSVGANAIQLAAAAGYEVISTASPKNHAAVRKLGATHVFDYRSKTLINDILAALKGRSLAGAYAIGDNAVEVCTWVLHRHPNTTHKFIAMAGGSPMGDKLASTFTKTLFIITMIFGVLTSILRSRFTGVKFKFIDLKDALDPHGVVAHVFVDFLPTALADRQFVPAPSPLVVGTGLDKIQEAMDVQMKGVSAQKIIVTL
ncbi:hypothetical protein DV738_g1894, partial [Chaetothyriales sp. CBS 135597]